jgi:ribosomal protein S1
MLETANQSEEWAKLKSELRVGQVIEGKVLAHWPFGIFVDLNKQFVGLIEIVNFRERGERMTPNEYPELGAPIRGVILQFNDGSFQVKLSARQSDIAAASK